MVNCRYNSSKELFNFIDLLQQNASIVVTTNKSLNEWSKELVDEILASAILAVCFLSAKWYNNPTNNTNWKIEK